MRPMLVLYRDFPKVPTSFLNFGMIIEFNLETKYNCKYILNNYETGVRS